MYKALKPDNMIFKSKEFQKDKYKFNLILKNLFSFELELFSDEDNYIICRGSKKWPTWIWTKDGFDKSVITDIEELIKKYLTNRQKDYFTCKKELYDMLVERNLENLNREDYFEMGFLICQQTHKPKECDGIYINGKIGYVSQIPFWECILQSKTFASFTKLYHLSNNICLLVS